jgi:hypothetical protein
MDRCFDCHKKFSSYRFHFRSSRVPARLLVGLCCFIPSYLRLYRDIEEFYDTKRVIRIRISKKNRQHNGQMKKNKMTNNDL